MKKSSDVNKKNMDLDTPLHVAAKYGRIDSARELLENGADTTLWNDDIYANQRRQPIHIAAENKHPEIIEAILNHSTDTLTQQVIRGGWYEVKEYQFPPSADILKISKRNEIIRPIDISVEQDDYESVRILLEKHEKKVSHSSNSCLSELSESLTIAYKKLKAGEIDNSILILLLEETKIIRLPFSEENFLQGAVLVSNLDIIKTIFNNINYWKDREDKENTRYHPPIEDYINEKDKAGKAPLHLASQEGNLLVMRLLVENGADIEVKDEAGNTPLHLASQKGNLPAVQLLVENKAYIIAKNKCEKTPLKLAEEGGYKEVAELLKKEKEENPERYRTCTAMFDWSDEEEVSQTSKIPEASRAFRRNIERERAASRNKEGQRL